MSMPKVLQDIRDVRDESITATSATLTDGAVVLEVPVDVCTGSVVKFTAPCACSSVTAGITIGSTTYSIVDAKGNAPVDAWASGAVVSVLLDCASSKAYIQNAADSNVFIAICGTTTYADIKAAYDAGKVCFCKKDTVIAPIVSVTNYLIVFIRNGTNAHVSYRVSSDDAWSETNHRMVDTEGATMTGALTLHGDPTESLHAATKQYVDANSGGKIVTAAIGTAWTEDEETGVKFQTVLISEVAADNTAMVDVYHSGTNTSESHETFVEQQNQYLEFITNGYAETVEGGITFYIYGDAPTVSIPIIVEVL